jgi:Clostripain family
MKRNSITLVVDLLAIVIVIHCGASGNVQASPPPPLAEWTVMVFMNGDNNLEPWAIMNFNQMAQVADSDQVNFIVQFDRKGTYASTDPNWARTLRFRIKKGLKPIPQDAVEDPGKKLNMGDKEVLRDFIRWAKLKYPAKKYLLVI